MPKVSTVPGWQHALIVLTGTVVGVVVVACLYWAQRVLVPVALAVFLSFLLTPPVAFLQRRHLRRTPSVVLVVLLAGLALGGLIWLVTAEVSILFQELPTYTENIKAKVVSLRHIGEGNGQLEKMIHDIAGVWSSPPAVTGNPLGDKSTESLDTSPEKPTPVFIQADNLAWRSWLPGLLSPLGELLGGLALALVLAVFMLLKRESLRDRLIRLVGHGRMTLTTKALDDAGHRISRFLLMQLMINATFGVVLTAGIYVLGIPNALLWGFLAAILRYVPYLGTCITSTVLIALSLAVFPGWLYPFLVLGFIVILELITANVAEPRLFGHSMGVSEVALLVSAAFWAFLWGPIGLILSSPLTVCLVVLGKYVPQLEFLDVLLGDEPCLGTDVSFYQRLLARDQDEAAQLVLTQAKLSPPENLYDEILIPTLNYVKQDRARDDLTEADELYILGATREIVEDLGERKVAADKAASPAKEAATATAPLKVPILLCPGHDASDALALEMLRQLLDPARWQVEILSVEILSAAFVARAGEREPAVICIGALPPGGLAHTRYLCKRLRTRLPNSRIVIGRWGLKDNLEENEKGLREAGADQVETTLLETRTHLTTWLPVLAPETSETSTNGPAIDESTRHGAASLQPICTS